MYQLGVARGIVSVVMAMERYDINLYNGYVDAILNDGTYDEYVKVLLNEELNKKERGLRASLSVIDEHFDLK